MVDSMDMNDGGGLAGWMLLLAGWCSVTYSGYKARASEQRATLQYQYIPGTGIPGGR